MVAAAAVIAIGYYIFSTNDNDDKAENKDDQSVKVVEKVKVIKEVIKEENSVNTEAEDASPDNSIDRNVIIECLNFLLMAIIESHSSMGSEILSIKDTISREQMAAKLVPCLKPITEMRKKLIEDFGIGEKELTEQIEKLKDDEDIFSLNQSVEHKLNMVKSTFRNAVTSIPE